MSEMIKVSIIVPVYNAEEYLEQCLNSIITQTLTDIEIICVDDGSTDASPRILASFAEKDDRIRIFHQENKYAGCARNLGMSHAGGKYLVFWDADDFFHRKALEKMYTACERDGADLCVCDVKVCDEESGRVFSGKYLGVNKLPEHLPFSRDEIGKYIFNFATNNPWNKMFRRDYIEERNLQFQALRQSNDAYFVMMALFYAKVITVVNERLVTYRKGNSASLTGRSTVNKYCVTQALRAVFESLSAEEGFNSQIRQSFYNKAFSMMRYSVRNQTDFDSYREMFDFYKKELFPELGLDQVRAEDIYIEQNQRDFEQWNNSSAEAFLLYDFKVHEHRSLVLAGRLRDTWKKMTDAQDKLEKTEEKLENKTAEADDLKTDLKKYKKRLEVVEGSTSYKAGRALTFVPRHLKEWHKQSREDSHGQGDGKG